jgi:hypothetical protein
MIPQHHLDNFDTLDRAFGDGAACLLECHERVTGKPVYVLCAVSRGGGTCELVPFAQLFDDNPYAQLLPPFETLSQPAID